MDTVDIMQPEPGAADLLLEHCFALDREQRCPTAIVRLEALLGTELTHRLVHALVSSR